MNIINQIKKLPWHETRRWGTRSISRIKKIIVHQELGESPVADVNRYHVEPNHISSKGCPHFCYHYGIEKDGTVIQANELSSVTWHCKGQNSVSVGIMLVGNFNGPGYDSGTSEPTEAQMASLKELVQYLQETLNLSNQDVFGHYHYGKPACPGYVVTEWIEKTRSELPAEIGNKPVPQKTVNEIQQRLNDLGYAAGPVDGIVGIMTLKAIRKFQADSGLHVDGVVGPSTWKTLLQKTQNT